MTTQEKYRERVRAAVERNAKRHLPKPARPNNPKKKQRDHPLESWEQARVVREMDLLGLTYCHVPNEGKRSKWGGHKLFTALGAKKAFPDLQVFDRLPLFPDARGLAIEMKRVKGSSPVWGSDDQHYWLRLLSKMGWKTYVCRGHAAAFYVLNLVGLRADIVDESAVEFVREFINK